ncbi:MAG: hypothetical protein HF973_04755 [Chloroflexi bacterium]|nr:hypothetical protein [Chloroflexota bacterium]
MVTAVVFWQMGEERPLGGTAVLSLPLQNARLCQSTAQKPGNCKCFGAVGVAVGRVVGVVWQTAVGARVSILRPNTQ